MPVAPSAALALASEELATSSPEAQGMSSDALIELTTWIRDSRLPIFSILVSRNGRLVYELYTSSLARDDAHYMMSVTKSVVSALVGIAIDRHLIAGADSAIGDSLPRQLFRSDLDIERLRPITVRRVLGMSALDAPDPPRRTDPDSVARYQRFWTAPDRLAVALEQPVLEGGFQYNDSTPTLATGALQYATGQSALDFAEDALFRPMGFRNYEWMHQDPAGIDNGGYGLRLRPIDMQKFGLLYLAHGAWGGRQLISKEWVARSFEPWNRSRPDLDKPDYGWYWWAHDYAPGWTAHVANGWKGQRIAVIPEQNMVVTMTGCIEDGSEQELFARIVKKYVMRSVERGATPEKVGNRETLAKLLEQVREGPSRMGESLQYRMIPSATPKQTHRAFVRTP